MMLNPTVLIKPQDKCNIKYPLGVKLPRAKVNTPRAEVNSPRAEVNSPRAEVNFHRAEVNSLKVGAGVNLLRV